MDSARAEKMEVLSDNCLMHRCTSACRPLWLLDCRLDLPDQVHQAINAVCGRKDRDIVPSRLGHCRELDMRISTNGNPSSVETWLRCEYIRLALLALTYSVNWIGTLSDTLSKGTIWLAGLDYQGPLVCPMFPCH